jgi:NAD(P)-dependent dehydrogenase (short-subunit alcohol dehydrogenase family)
MSPRHRRPRHSGTDRHRAADDVPDQPGRRPPEGTPGLDDIVESIESATYLGRAATLADVGSAAAFAASDWARTITGSAINITCGTEADGA